MAPYTAKKRGRVEDEVRGKKKKPRPVKKQKNYHSSSEEEDDDVTTQRASDAPRKQPKYIVKADETAETKAQIGSTTSKPKSILKRATPSQSEPEAPARESDDNSEGHEDEDEGVEVDELEKNTALNTRPAAGSDDSEIDMEVNDEPALDGSDDDDDSGSDASATSATSSNAIRLGAKKKRNDPDAFATSISKILSTKLSTSKRSDPVLSRSKSAAEANASLADSKLEQKARAQIRAEKRATAERGRVKDVLGLETEDVDTGAILEEEKRLKKTAQRGVVRLFNAVRAAQVKAEEAMREARKEGVVGMQKREERVNEMSKQGFLDLISKGGKTSTARRGIETGKSVGSV